jgi:hypothetical protein
MTMTSLQVGHLRRALQSPVDDLAREPNRASAKTTYPVWTMNGVADVNFHHAGTKEPVPWGGDHRRRSSTNSSGPPRPNPFWPNGFCGGSLSWTACTWSRRRG